MDIIVPYKFVPDLVEELEIDEGTGLLDRMFLRMIPNELDEHALEEALILKEEHGGTVTVISLDTGDVDESLFTAVAKGADRVVKIEGEGFEEGVDSHRSAAQLIKALEGMSFDLILTGTQAVDDLDGSLGSLLAAQLGIPFVGYITGVEAVNGKMLVRKEYPGGLIAEIETDTPAVLGIQAAEKPPRYVVTSLVMEAMKSAEIETREASEVEPKGLLEVDRMQIPEAGERAQMVEGDAGQVAEALVAALQERGLLP